MSEDYRDLVGCYIFRNALILFGTVTSYGLDGSQQCKIFLFSTESIPTVGPTQRPMQWAQGDPLSGIMQMGHEANHSLLSSTMVKNGGAASSLTLVSSWHSA
jgi:hypothetical protein